jgi:hypothetical protein
MMACEGAATDYPGESWNACISDDGVWHQTGESPPSSIARVASFETIADLLWRGEGIPNGQAFLDARIEYSIDSGLDSRVSRRYDAHLERPEEGINCRGEDHGQLYPDYCVGPGKINPLLAQAFADGSQGLSPLVNAARVEAGLLWFLHVSTYKEGYTCKDAAKDCDSSWAYYGAGDTQDVTTGLASYVRAIEPGTHASIFQGLLAIRCWRDLDNSETAMNPEMHQKALGQLDRGLNRALTILLIGRLNAFANAEGDARAPHWAFLQVLGPVLDRAARAADAGIADRLASTWQSDGMAVDAEGVIADLNALFPCP